MVTVRDARGARLRGRGGVVVAAVLLVVLALVIGGRLDRAPTEGRYRPVLPPSVLDGDCSPLPSDVVLDLDVQVRADRPLAEPSGDQVRRLDLHYDLVEENAARGRVVAALTAGGFIEIPTPTGADPAVDRWFSRPGYGRVGVAVRAFDVDVDTIVRGAITLDLPADTLTDAVEATCADPQQTKRYPEYAEESS